MDIEQIKASGQVFVDASCAAVMIDGVRFALPEAAVPSELWDGFIGMSWWPGAGAKTAGHVTTQGDAHGFDDFERIEPFVRAWLVEFEAYRARQRDVKEAEDREQALMEAEAQALHAKLEAEREEENRRFEPVRKAMQMLVNTQADVERALDAVLVERNMMTPQTAHDREAARMVVRSYQQHMEKGGRVLDWVAPNG